MTERTVGRVFLVTWWFDQLGGMERHLVELACALTRAGVDLTVFSELPVPSDNQYRLQLAEMRVPLIAGSPVREHRNTWRRRLYRTRVLAPFLNRRPHWGPDEFAQGDLLSRDLLDALRQRMEAGKPDVIHIHGVRLGQSWVLEWARQQGVATVYTEHSAILEFGGPAHIRSADRAMRATLLASVSEHARQDLLDALPRPRAIEVVHHIVREPAIRQAQGLPSPFHWACVARLDRRKGVHVLLDAFRECSVNDARYQLSLAGDGPERQRLERQAVSLGIASRVQFLGRIDSGRVSRLLSAVGAFVLPSLSEGQPLALVEAMAHGKAVVASAVGGIPELVRDGETGLLVAPEESAALAAAMRRVSEDAALRARLEAGAVEAFRQSPHHERSVVQEMLALYARARDSARHADGS